MSELVQTYKKDLAEGNVIFQAEEEKKEGGERKERGDKKEKIDVKEDKTAKPKKENVENNQAKAPKPKQVVPPKKEENKLISEEKPEST